MANTTFTCQSCGTKVTGLKYTHGGKNYCYACYQNLQQQLSQQEQQKQALYSYIKDLFGITELPVDVLSGLDREFNSGKKAKGMELTIKYYYVIQGHQASAVSSVPYVIHDYYEAAKQYITKNKQIQEINQQVDLNIPPVTVVVNPANLTHRVNKPRYNIEDL